MTQARPESPAITLLEPPAGTAVTLDPRPRGVALQLHQSGGSITEILLDMNQFDTLADDCRRLAEEKNAAPYSDGEMTITVQPEPDSKIALTPADWRSALDAMPWELHEENESWLHELNGHVMAFIHSFPDSCQDGENILLHMTCQDTVPEKPGRHERIASGPRLAGATLRLRLKDPVRHRHLLKAIAGEEYQDHGDTPADRVQDGSDLDPVLP